MADPFPNIPPDRMWWCFTCHGGVGSWGRDSPDPPPRCPECRTSNFSLVKFVKERVKDSDR